MSKLDFLKSKINHNRFLMGLLVACDISIFGYVFTNFDKINIYLYLVIIFSIVIISSLIIYLELKTRKEMERLKDL